VPVDTTPAARTQPVHVVHNEEELSSLVADGEDTIVKIAFTWCRPCRRFWPTYKKFASLYSNTRFLKIVGNKNESCKRYAIDVLKAKTSPIFAAYHNGKLVATWDGADNGHFMEMIEEVLPSARKLAMALEEAVARHRATAPP